MRVGCGNPYGKTGKTFWAGFGHTAPPYSGGAFVAGAVWRSHAPTMDGQYLPRFCCGITRQAEMPNAVLKSDSYYERTSCTS